MVVARCAVRAALLLFWVTRAATAATFVVSPDGADDGPGSAERPWRSVARANRGATAGDTVVLQPGRYEGVIEPVASGTADRPLVWRAARPGTAVILGGTSSDGKRVCLRLLRREWVQVAGLVFEPQHGGWMHLEGARHCVLRDLDLVRSFDSYSPAECRDSHHNRYEALRLDRAAYRGSSGHAEGDMWNNFGCTHNVFLACVFRRAGHRPLGLWYDCDHNVVRRCVFDCRWGRNFEFFSTPRLLMEECLVTNGFDGSGSADGRAKLFVVDSIVRRNLIWRNWAGPLVINSYKYGDLPVWEMAGSRVYHNTWYRNFEHGFEMIDLDAQPKPHRVRDNEFRNNLFADNDPGGDGLSLLLYSNIAPDNRFVANLLWGGRPEATTVFYDWNFAGASAWPGQRYTADEANRARPEQFAGNLAAPPGFVDAAGDDFRLRAGSPAADAGQPLTTTRAAGRGRQVPVGDARWFYDGFQIAGEVGDLVWVGPERREARVVAVDLAERALTLDRELSWSADAPVSLPYAGPAPDLGAYERGAEAAAWYQAPQVVPGLRQASLEERTAPLTVDFEAATFDDWGYLFNFSRQQATEARLDETTAGGGRRSMRVFATGPKAILSCDIRPPAWDIDRYPVVEFAYRIPSGVPVGLWLHPFRSRATGYGGVCVGGSPARQVGSRPDLKHVTLTDDDHWHRVTVDARWIREVYPSTRLLLMFRFATQQNGQPGQQYWFDEFAIRRPAGWGAGR